MKLKPTHNIIALGCSLWFLSFGWVWIYWINVIFVFPIAIIGFFLWQKERAQSNTRLNAIVGWILIGGVITSLGSLLILIMRGYRN